MHNYGGKIANLQRLEDLGFSVPSGWPLPASQIKEWLLSALPDLPQTYGTLNRQTVEHLLSETPFPNDWREDLLQFLDPTGVYIVRSSALLEDGSSASFAGQYDSILHCRGIDEVEAGIRSCVASLFNPEAQRYFEREGFDLAHLGMAVIVQEQLDPAVAGVAFSMDLLANDDQRMVIEYVPGLATGLVDGHVQPHQVSLGWYDVDWNHYEEDGLLSRARLQELHAAVLKIVDAYGRPMDIEWAVQDDQLYLLQARPITTLPSQVAEGRWTTANFRDGGVAAQDCPGLMWSLYRHSWQISLSSFLERIGLSPVQPLPALSVMHVARPYWNLGIVKEAMKGVPGYIERDFDDELGVKKDYIGKGFETKLSPKLLWNFAGVAYRTYRLTKQHQNQAPQLLEDLRSRLSQVEEDLADLKEEMRRDSKTALRKLEGVFRNLVTELYLDCEGTYFKQVFINTVHLSMKKTALLKKMSADDFFNLIAHIGNVSHTKPIAAVLEIVDILKAHPDWQEDWRQPADSAEWARIFEERQANLSSIDTQIFEEQSEGRYESGPTAQNCLVSTTDIAVRPDWDLTAAYLRSYGHHSRRELDLRVPSYVEEPERLRDLVLRILDDASYEAALRASLQSEKHLQALDRKTQKTVDGLRELLWWREEFKDISTRTYHLIRQVSLALGRAYEWEGYLRDASDVFYIEKEELLAFMDKSERDLESLQKQAAQGRHYARAYRKVQAPGDLMPAASSVKRASGGAGVLSGMAANAGRVTGRVRLILDLADLDQIKPGEILVTRFTDTGWSYVFGILGGLVTETGGVLCHASIVARECGIPALVCVEGATARLKTGMLVTLDSQTGQIVIEE